MFLQEPVEKQAAEQDVLYTVRCINICYVFQRGVKVLQYARREVLSTDCAVSNES